MSEETMQTMNKSTIKGEDGEVTEPVHVVRNGAIPRINLAATESQWVRLL